MGKGLLAWWRRRIVARGLAGAALFAVPVAVAALIGFGGGFAGVAGGLTSVTNGPDAVPASAQTAPNKLNRAVVALASKQTGSGGPSRTSSHDGGGSSGGSTGTDTSGGGSTGSGTGSSGSQSPVVDTPSAPDVNLPTGGSTGDTVNNTTNAVNNTVNNALGGVNNTLNGLLGGGH